MARLRSRARGPSAGPFGVGADGPRRGRQAPAANVPRLPRAGGSLLLDFAAGACHPQHGSASRLLRGPVGFPEAGLASAAQQARDRWCVATSSPGRIGFGRTGRARDGPMVWRGADAEVPPSAHSRPPGRVQAGAGAPGDEIREEAPAAGRRRGTFVPGRTRTRPPRTPAGLPCRKQGRMTWTRLAAAPTCGAGPIRSAAPLESPAVAPMFGAPPGSKPGFSRQRCWHSPGPSANIAAPFTLQSITCED